jgi:L-iditol 2-dehydrogenase
MLASIWDGPAKPLRLSQVPLPEIKAPSDVLVRVEQAMFGAALVRAVTVGHPKLVPPKTLGSLIVGEVVAVGTAVQHVGPGRRVVLNPHAPCMACDECLRHTWRLCERGVALTPGALADFVVISGNTQSAIVPIPEVLRKESAIFAEPLACALAAIEDADIRAEDHVLIVGSGPMALLLAQAARRTRAVSTTCCIKYASRSAVFAATGASVVALPAAGKRVEGAGIYTVAIEAVGAADAYLTCFDAVAPGGTIVAFAGYPPNTVIPLDINDLHYRCTRIIGSYHYRPNLFMDALDLLIDSRVDTEAMQAHSLDIASITSAPALAREPDVLTVLVSFAPR